MFQVIKTEYRPNINVEFASMTSSFIDPAIRQYFSDTYKKTGKCILVDTTITDDDKLYTSMNLWESEEAYNEYTSDPTIKEGFFIPIREYAEANNIVITLVSKQNV